MADDNNEIRFLKLELGHVSNIESISKVEARVSDLENDHTSQVRILDKLSQTVETLTTTVGTLSTLTRDLDKGQEVFKSRFNTIIGILSTIGIAVITGVVKVLFFSGG